MRQADIITATADPPPRMTMSNDAAAGTPVSPAVRPGRERFLTFLLMVYVALKVAILFSYSWNAQYIMDEYAQVGHSMHVADGSYGAGAHPTKTVLYAYVFYPARLIGRTSVEVMRAARIETMLLACGVLALLFFVSRRLQFSPTEALFGLAVFLAFSNVMQHSFRARSDCVALFFEVAAFAVASSGSVRSPRRAAVVGALLGLAYLSTQKAAYAAIAVAFALTVALLSKREVRRLVAVGLACLASFAAVLVLYGIALGGLRFQRTIGETFTNAAVVVVRGGISYADIRIPYILQTLGRNWIAYLLCVAGLAIAGGRWRTLTAEQRFAVVFTVVFVVLVFTNNQPWPYIFVSAAAFLAPWSGGVSRELSLRLGGDGVLASIGIIAVLAFSFGRDVAYERRDNSLQNAVSNAAEQLLSPADRYQDGIGMLPTRRLAPDVWWDRINIVWIEDAVARRDYSILQRISSSQPKLWILNYRVEALGAILRPIINKSYVRVDRNILLAGSEVTAADRWFVSRWKGRYTLYDSSGRELRGALFVDGREVRVPLQLDTAAYRVRAAAAPAGRLFLLPVGVTPGRSLPAAGPPLNVFENVYE